MGDGMANVFPAPGISFVDDAMPVGLVEVGVLLAIYGTSSRTTYCLEALRLRFGSQRTA